MPLSYAALTPDAVLDACDSAGCRADGRLAPLNSYENRVYQVWLEDGGSVVPKFYRPGRWTARQIAEEHAFARALAEQEIPGVAPSHERGGGVRSSRLHGDCHAGNILWTESGPHFVDLDDARMGPALQDLWMLLSGERRAMTRQLSDLLAGYEDFMPFERRELPLLEALRTLRLIHYCAWLARRWDDPAFPAAFPWFGTQRYWQDRILELREQIAAMDEEPLSV